MEFFEEKHFANNSNKRNKIFHFFVCFFFSFCQTDVSNASGMLLHTLEKNCHASKHIKFLKVQLQKNQKSREGKV